VITHSLLGRVKLHSLRQTAQSIKALLNQRSGFTNRTKDPERRRDPRTVTSVMSEVFVASGKSGQLRYFAPAILVDVSESGLALMMDIAPEGHHHPRA
jgi:hypothetical protein